MNYYEIIKKILFRLEPELAHVVALNSLKLIPQRCFKKVPAHPCEVMGLKFTNPIGVAAGLDKNGDYIDALAKLGFGFIEVGTVTPKPQPGNAKPRLFRLPETEGLINRLGFNNKGVDHLVKRLQRCRYKGIIGVNVGKNLSTPIEEALKDYQACYLKVYPYAHYVTLNISSPNTPDLRTLQYAEHLKPLLLALKQQQSELAKHYDRYVPIAVKLSPDLSSEELQTSAKILQEAKVDAVIATNTTVRRLGVEGEPGTQEKGGLSGRPLTTLATEALKQLRELLPDNIPLIGVGGILSPTDAQAKFRAGANLLQVYTGIIFRGPELITALTSLEQEQNAHNTSK